MKILFITNYYPPFEVGGYEQLCRDMAIRLAERGHTFTVLTSNRGVEFGNEEAEPGIYRLLRVQPQFDGRLSPVIQFFLTHRRTEAYNRRIFQKIVKQFRPDLVFFWNLEGLPHELTLDAEAMPGIAVAYWLAGYTPTEPDLFWRYWTQSPGKRAFLESIKSRMSRRALAQMQREGKPVRPQMRHVAVVSEYMRQKGMVENTLPSHTEVIYNGVETDIFYRPSPSPGAPPPIKLLLAGRVSSDKGVHVAVDAMGKLAQARPQNNFRLIIAGSGPAGYLDELKRLAVTYGVEDLISFLGWLPREQMPGLMHTCHILLLTAIYPEAFARVILEGMAAGLAVVGTLTGGTGELLQDGRNGLACAAEDSHGLARQIDQLLDDPHLRHRLACQGQEMVLKKYSLDHMVDRIETLLERAVAEQNERNN